MTRLMGYLHKTIRTFIIISRWILFRIRNISEKVVEKIKTYILYSVTSFWKSYLSYDNVEKYDTATQATNYNIITAKTHCMLDK
jgi:hypothetical protein